MFRAIRPISLSKLKKLEHSPFVEDVVNVLEQFDFEALQLQTGMSMLIQLRPQLLKLEDKYGPHPLTNEIKKANDRRLELAGAISSKLQVLQRANLKHQSEAVEVVVYPIRGCLLGIRKEDQEAATGKLNQFFKEVDEDEMIQEALLILGFHDFLSDLREVHALHEALFDERMSSLSKRHTRESKSIQKECQAVLRNLFAQIELAQRLYQEQDYTLLIDTLNIVIAKYTKGIKRRETYNRKRAEAAAKAAAEKESKFHILSVDGKETGSITIVEKAKEKKAKVKRTTKEQPKEQTNKSNAKENKPQKKEGGVYGLLDKLKLPLGKKE